MRIFLALSGGGRNEAYAVLGEFNARNQVTSYFYQIKKTEGIAQIHENYLRQQRDQRG